MRIGIVDDSAEDRKLVRMEMERCLESSGMEPAEYNEYDSADAFLSTFEAGMFDLIFLDICMDDASGIDTGLGIRKTDRNVRIVFITSSNDYAAESYQVRAAHYLLKPHTFAQFHEMFLELLPARQQPPEESFVNLPDGSRVACGDIVFTEYYNHYVYFHLCGTQEVRRVYMSQREIEKLLCERQGFASCSRGIIVNFDKIRRFTDTVLYLQDDSGVPVSRRRLRAVKDAYAEYMYLP